MRRFVRAGRAHPTCSCRSFRATRCNLRRGRCAVTHQRSAARRDGKESDDSPRLSISKPPGISDDRALRQTAALVKFSPRRSRQLSERHTAALPARDRHRFRGRARSAAHDAGRGGRARARRLPARLRAEGRCRPALDLVRAARLRSAGAGAVPRRLVSLLRPHHGRARGSAAGDRGAGCTSGRHHARHARAWSP